MFPKFTSILMYHNVLYVIGPLVLIGVVSWLCYKRFRVESWVARGGTAFLMVCGVVACTSYVTLVQAIQFRNQLAAWPVESITVHRILDHKECEEEVLATLTDATEIERLLKSLEQSHRFNPAETSVEWEHCLRLHQQGSGEAELSIAFGVSKHENHFVARPFLGNDSVGEYVLERPSTVLKLTRGE